jgi:hypothetical protein
MYRQQAFMPANNNWTKGKASKYYIGARRASMHNMYKLFLLLPFTLHPSGSGTGRLVSRAMSSFGRLLSVSMRQMALLVHHRSSNSSRDK